MTADSFSKEIQEGKKNPYSQIPDETSLTMRTHRVKAFLEFVTNSFEDDSIKGDAENPKKYQDTQRLAILELDDSDAATMALTAWLPDEEGHEHYNEVPALIPKFNAAVRLACHRSAKYFPRPHFFIMTEPVYKQLEAFYDAQMKAHPTDKMARRIDVKILPCDQEGMLG